MVEGVSQASIGASRSLVNATAHVQPGLDRAAYTRAAMADLRPWQVVSREVVFSGGPVREVSKESVRLPDNRFVPDYYVVRFPDYVLVYAEMEDGRVAMLRQYKHGPRRVCLTFPGGAI